MKPPTDENAVGLADLVGAIQDHLPEGVTYTIIIVGGDTTAFQVAISGSTPERLLRLVFEQSLERMDGQVGPRR
jgi:hypothetical protein